VDRTLVGYVRKAHGIKGSVIVRPLTDDPSRRWAAGSVLTSDAEPPAEYTVVTATTHPAGLLVHFSGVNDRSAAEGLKGTSFSIPSDERRNLDDGEYWPDELVGCTVVDEAGELLGTVEAIEFGGAQDRLVVRTERGAVEVPLVDAIIPIVDIDGRRIVATPPPGLFDAD